MSNTDAAGLSDLKQAAAPGEPFCSNCGYLLRGLDDSSHCPECGKSFVDVLVRGRQSISARQKRFRTEALLWGLPIVDIAIGLDEHGKPGRARGIIAIGDTATGLFAVGNKWATGIVAVGGGGALGVCTIGGGIGVGLLSTIGGGLALGAFALGGFAAGGLAVGGIAIGIIAQGGMAIGYFARGGYAIGQHVITAGRVPSPIAIDFFRQIEPIIGGARSPLSTLTPVLAAGTLFVLATGLVMFFALFGYRRWQRTSAR